MASTEDITLNGVEPVGRHEPHYGDEKVVYDEVTLANYDNASDGNGNDFDVSQIYGFSRLFLVDLEVLGTDAYEARYDYTNNSILVLDLSSSGAEVSQGTTLNIDIRVRVIGTGG